ncbi:hypothetical protein J6590_044886 [Homalodisca vitripennis]|nr:hypothetical protein J6590_044886 [Homalodisca vitripennis]
MLQCKIQQCALKIISLSCKDTSSFFDILTVVSIYIIEVINHVSTENLSKVGEVHSHNTLQANDLFLQAHRTPLYSKKLSVSVAGFFNMLPKSLRCEFVKTSRKG